MSFVPCVCRVATQEVIHLDLGRYSHGGSESYRDARGGRPESSPQRRRNLPEHAITADGHLFVADTGNNRVLVGTSIEAARSRQRPDVILGEIDLTDVTPEIGQAKLFWPGWLAYDGGYLWVGEYKSSHRLMRFSRQPAPDR